LNDKKLTQAYCEYLLATQTNYTLTYFANHGDGISHDKMTRGLRVMDMDHNDIWCKIKDQIEADANGYVLFDDSVLDKNYSQKIEMVRRQYSGNAHGIIRGIGVVNCVYVNSITKEEFIIDYRIFNPDEDGKSKLEHVSDMLDSIIADKKIDFKYILMDTWYATKDLLLKIEGLEKIYYCPIKSNRLVDDSNRVEKMKPLSSIFWSEEELIAGKEIHINNFPSGHRVQVFRLEVSTNRTDYIVTNSKAKYNIEDIRSICSIRWKIEQFHREIKQITGIEKCQCRIASSQKNHIACAILLLSQLKYYARKINTNVYQLKQGLLTNYMINELKNPSLKIDFA
jgi:hypothetical protein